MPVVSPKPISWAPASRRRAAISSTRSGGTWPSYGQPNEVEITPSQRTPAARARASTASRPASDSAIERLTFLRLWVSDADMKTLISSNAGRSPRGARAGFPRRAAGARCAPGARAQLQRRVQPALVGDQHRHADLRRHVDPRQHLGGVGELRDHVRRARSSSPPAAAGRCARARRSARSCARWG